jgi:hypothetical protein
MRPNVLLERLVVVEEGEIHRRAARNRKRSDSVLDIVGDDIMGLLEGKRLYVDLSRAAAVQWALVAEHL